MTTPFIEISFCFENPPWYLAFARQTCIRLLCKLNAKCYIDVLKSLIFKIIHFHRFCFYLQEEKIDELIAVRSSLPQLEEKFNNISLKVSGQFLQQPRLLLFLCCCCYCCCCYCCCCYCCCWRCCRCCFSYQRG